MNINVETKYDIGDEVLVNKEFKGQVVGLRLTISTPPNAHKNILIIEKSYLVNVNDEVVKRHNIIVDYVQQHLSQFRLTTTS